MNIFEELAALVGVNIGVFKTDRLPEPNVNTPMTPEQIAKSSNPKGIIPAGRISDAPMDYNAFFDFENEKYFIQPGYQYEVIALIRKLSISNQSVSQALANIVNLANTGHKLQFDANVSADKVVEMTTHIETAVKTWHYGVASCHGLANKMFSQAMICGAVCAEIVPNKKFTGIYRFLMPMPESIRFVYDKPTISYLPYQRTRNILDAKPNEFGLKRLNINSFRYVAINGDTESPYGNPPYLPALGPLEDQHIMLDNIKFIIKQIGLVGFLEVLVDKPTQIEFETDPAYRARVTAYLDEVKMNLSKSMKDGIMVGVQEDHEFEFHSATANASGVSELFEQNEILVSSGLKQDPSLAGKATGSETGITIIFTKLISELKNIQIAVASVLQDLYALELRLAGYTFNTLDVVFDPSTVQDDLKMQQAQEIKVRNNRQMRMDGLISQDTYASNMGLDKAHQQTPVVPYAPNKPTSGDPSADAQSKAAREKKKDVSDKKVRAKNKPQAKKVR